MMCEDVAEKGIRSRLVNACKNKRRWIVWVPVIMGENERVEHEYIENKTLVELHEGLRNKESLLWN